MTPNLTQPAPFGKMSQNQFVLTQIEKACAIGLIIITQLLCEKGKFIPSTVSKKLYGEELGFWGIKPIHLEPQVPI